MTLRDHKPNFAHKPTCRLTNPIKYNIGRFSKTILDRINNKITRASRFNQWRNTASVIEWFKALPLHQPRPPEQSTRLSFSLRHHQRRRTIIASCNTCKTFDPYAQTATLAKESRYKIWRPNGQLRRCWKMRASGKPFLLSQRQNLNINIGLYRDDGLAISNATPRETDNRKYAEVFFDEAS